MQVAIDCVPAWQDSREGAFKSPPQVTQPPTEALPAFSGRRLHTDTYRSLNLPLEGRRPHSDTHRSLNLPQRPCRPSLFATWLVPTGGLTLTLTSHSTSWLHYCLAWLECRTGLILIMILTNDWTSWRDYLLTWLEGKTALIFTHHWASRKSPCTSFLGGQLCCPLARLESRR